VIGIKPIITAACALYADSMRRINQQRGHRGLIRIFKGTLRNDQISGYRKR